MAEEQRREPWQDMASTKEELIAILWRMRADIERFAADAGPERMEVPGVAGDWCLKDVIAHLNAWRWWSVARMEGAMRNEKPRPPWKAEVDEWEEGNVDQINEEFFESARKSRSMRCCVIAGDLRSPGRRHHVPLGRGPVRQKALPLDGRLLCCGHRDGERLTPLRGS